MECTRHTTLELGNRREIVVGEVKAFAIRQGLMDQKTLNVDQAGLDTIGRLGGNLYTRTQEILEMRRPDSR